MPTKPSIEQKHVLQEGLSMAMRNWSCMQRAGGGGQGSAEGQRAGQGGDEVAAVTVGQPTITGAKAELAVLCPGHIPICIFSGIAAALDLPLQASIYTDCIKADATADILGH